MRTLILLALLCTPAAAQSINIDVGENFGCCYPVPASTHAGAASQSGVWNASIHPYSTSLVDLTGAPTTATTSSTNPGWYNYFPSLLTGDDYNLMVDIQSFPGGTSQSWTFSGLQNGDYALYTYAWAPDSGTARTRVTVPSSIDPAVLVGGSWGGGAHIQNVTYALHRVTVTTGTFSLQVEGLASSGSVNAFQLVFTPAPGGPTPFCFGDGTGIACPCANNGAAGNGCASSVTALGGRLGSSGSASISADTFTLTSTNVPTGPGLFFQGTSQLIGGNGVFFGDGLLCAGGSIIRLGVVFAVANTASYPGGLTPNPIGSGGLNAIGDVRTYQEWYRDGDPGFCSSSTFNLTNGVQVTWAP
ncbi:MAG: hypothetical protein SGI72_13670 [Planctomycetota bacterium]|nr:hypothetical protein [Planctomycetota bacterium]